MRKKALIGLSVLIVAVSGSANVLDSFGVVSGETSVEGPTFWVGESSELYLEEQDGVTSTTDRAEFVYDLGSSSEWYDLTAEMKTRVAENNDSVDKINVTLDFQALDSNGNVVSNCKQKYSENVSASYDDSETGVSNTVSGSCDIDLDSQIDRFRYIVETDKGNDMAIQRYGDTKIEVNAQ